ncbi:MAG: SBDS family ribosome assembly factor [Methanothrix sp.]
MPPAHAPKAYGEIATFGKLQKEQWQNDGSWIGVVRIPAGLQNEFYSLVNRLSKGDAETKLLKR